MKTFSTLALIALATLGSTRSASAAVNPAIIPADARWVIYADFNSLRSTAVGKELVAAARKMQADSKAVVGVDVEKLLATIGTVTAYGSNFSPDPKALDGTLVVQGTPELRKIVEGLLLQGTIATQNVTENNDLPFPAYTITPKQPTSGEVANGAGVVIAFPPEQVVLVSKSKAQLIKAREVFRGGGASLAKNRDAALRSLLPTSADAYLFAASIVPADIGIPENQPQARILKMTNSGALGIGENGQNTFAHLNLLATSDQMADKLMKIVQGMTAMLSLAETNDKQLAEFINSANVARNDRTVTVNLSYSSDRLAQMIHKLQEEHPRRTAEEVAAARAAQLINGRALDQWQAESVPAGSASTPAPVVWRTIDNVVLKNGSIISLGRQSNGGKPVRFDRVEITPADGGAALTFRTEFMRAGGQHGSLSLFQFPGADGTYTVKVGYINDPEGKARYAVSVREPKAAATTTKTTDSN